LIHFHSLVGFEELLGHRIKDLLALAAVEPAELIEGKVPLPFSVPVSEGVLGVLLTEADAQLLEPSQELRERNAEAVRLVEELEGLAEFCKLHLYPTADEV